MDLHKRCERTQQEAEKIFKEPAEVLAKFTGEHWVYELIVYKQYFHNVTRAPSPEACLQAMKEKNGYE